MAKEKREILELRLGRKIHEVGKQQKIANDAVAKLKKFQNEANEIDDEIEKLDG